MCSFTVIVQRSRRPDNPESLIATTNVVFIFTVPYNRPMNKHNHHRIIALLRIGFGLLIVAAFITQMHYTLDQGRSLANFFSFFTIQSNLLAAFVLLTVGIAMLVNAKAKRQFAFIRGAATLYMVITGIVFALLLSGLEQRLQVTVPWVNMVFHQLMPVVMLVDWLLFPPKFKFSFRQTILWLAFPLLYLAYTLIRGPIVQWYPYPFLDPPQVGWPYVIVMSIIIAFGAAGLAWLLTLRTRSNRK